MTNCIKTGARVYLDDYGLAAPADLFEVGESIIVRFNGNPQNYGTYTREMPENTTHVVHCNPPRSAWVRFDLGVIVVEAHLVAQVAAINS